MLAQIESAVVPLVKQFCKSLIAQLTRVHYILYLTTKFERVYVWLNQLEEKLLLLRIHVKDSVSLLKSLI